MSDLTPADENQEEPDHVTPEPDEPEESRAVFKRVTGIGTSAAQAALVPALALLTALIVGAFIIAVTDIDTLVIWGEDPVKAFGLTMTGIYDAYRALFIGSMGSPNAISETLFAATPLIFAGLAVAIGFQAGLFNIGVNGQMHIGGMAALYVGFTFALPAVFHIPLALAAAIVGGAFWAGISGFLKARTGAHEVITTIMLNFIALFLVDYLLTTSLFQAPRRNDPISEKDNPSAQ